MEILKAVPDLNESLLEGFFHGHVIVRVLSVSDHYSALHPIEQQHIKDAVLKRRQEFSTGRVCAHSALGNLGQTSDAILAGEKREPIWPDGVVGSISHSGNCCVAGVSTDPNVLSIGLDVETREGVSKGVRDLVCTCEELEALEENKDNPELWKLIFSAKESIYKSLYPVLKCWISFSQASLYFDFNAMTYTVVMDESLNIPDDILQNMHGRFVVSEDYLFTSMEIMCDTALQG